MAMDKIQEKLEELAENLTALDTCIAIGKLEFTDIILYLQYDVPIEKSNIIYSYMKESFQNSENSNRYTINERNYGVTSILRQTQSFITRSERDGNMATTVYKDAYDIAGQICDRLKG